MRNVKEPSHESGFSLIELVIYVSMFLVVLTSVFQLLESNRAAYDGGQRKMEVQQNARLAIDEITKQLRMPGYYPENFDANAGNDLTATNAIQIATNNALAVFGDVDGSGASNVFFYCLDGTNLRRGKSALASPSYVCSTGEILGENINSLNFVYYDAAGATIPTSGTTYLLDGQAMGATPTFITTTQRAAVRRVVVTLTARQTVPRQAAQTYTLTSDVRLRNIN